MVFRLASPLASSTEAIVTNVIDSAHYRERPIRVQRLDLVAENLVLVELKAIERRLGLLMNLIVPG